MSTGSILKGSSFERTLIFASLFFATKRKKKQCNCKIRKGDRPVAVFQGKSWRTPVVKGKLVFILH